MKETAKKGQLVENPDTIAYTYDEVAKHATEDDCWTVYEGRIYDVTEYARSHPGGKKIFMGKGKDCTEIFKKYHSWVNCHFMIGKYQVGVVRPN
jgi:cytochrome b involved in lipid metabolism